MSDREDEERAPKHKLPMAPEGDDAVSVPAPERRGFMLRLGIGMNVVAAALVGVPIIGFVFSAARSRAYSKWVVLGRLSQFPIGETRKGEYVNPYTVPWDGHTAKIPCWVRRVEQDAFQIFAINCTHLGCPVRWFKESGLFMCPCHGGVFYANGQRASGPPPRGLYEYEYKIEGDHVWVRAGHMPTLHSTLKDV